MEKEERSHKDAGSKEADFRVVRFLARLSSPFPTDLPTTLSASSLSRATTFLWESCLIHTPGYPGTFSSPSSASVQSLLTSKYFPTNWEAETWCQTWCCCSASPSVFFSFSFVKDKANVK